MAGAGPEFRTVLFPMEGTSELTALHVELAPAFDQIARFASAPHLPEAVDILMDARVVDPAATRADGVQVTVERSGFAGKSYGLSLAIADKQMRFGSDWPGVVVATGVIAPRGRGGVAGIDGFAAKVNAVISHSVSAPTPVAFAFPRANWDAADADVRAALEAAEVDGRLTLVRCTSISDAQRLWRTPGPARRPLWAVLLAAMLLLMGGVAAWQYVSLTDVRACRASVQAMPDHDAPPAMLAATIASCERAARRLPDDGHLAFQIGQLRALDDNERLAAAAWKRAAELGDADGMASYGRWLWQSDTAPGRSPDPASVDRALLWLKGAAAAGSPAAADDIGAIMLDAGKMEEARIWMIRAREQRAKIAKAR